MSTNKTIIFIAMLMLVALKMGAQNIEPSKKVLYKVIDGDSLYLHVFEPKTTIETAPTAAVVFFFGGGWTSGNPKQFYQQSEYLASRGMLAISAEYRTKNTYGTTPFECVEDGKSAIRWVREHAKELHIDPNKIVAGGGSAGGHVATCTAVIDGFENASENLTISSVPNAVIGYNPVIDTTEKGYGAKKVKGRETEISPCHNVKSDLPPMLFFHGKKDTTVPFENADRFNRLMHEAGNKSELVAVENVGHGFFNGSFFRNSSDDKYYNLTMYHTDLFLQDLGYLTGKATIASTEGLTFEYSEITGVGKDSKYNRRDNSDIIKVNDTYYIWYTRMDKPTTSGYWGTIWYATSKDEGYTWQEQGMALGLGEKGAFDSHSVFTPNILEFNGQYYLYYTGVKPTPNNKNNEFENNAKTDITALGLAVSDSPDGPFERVENNPVLTISNVAKDFDSYRIDDASMLVRDNKIALYYKGRSLIHGTKGAHHTQMGVAFSETPEGPFEKHIKPILDKSHEVLIWNENEGVSSLASINQTVNYAPDGVNFYPLYDDLTNIPKAPGLYRSSLTGNHDKTIVPTWGIAMIQKKKEAYLIRFEIKKEQ